TLSKSKSDSPSKRMWRTQMRKLMSVNFVVASIALSATGAMAQSKVSAGPSSPATTQMRNLVNDTRAVVKTYNQQQITTTTGQTLGGSWHGTSWDRPANSPLASPA